MIKLIEAWKNKKAGLIGILTSFIIFLWPAIPLKGVGVWLKTLSSTSFTLFLYSILALLSGSFVVLYIYDKQCKTCEINPSGGAFASIFGVLLGACPACIPVLAFFLPLSVSITLSYFSQIFLLLSIFILLFIIYRMGGFKDESRNIYIEAMETKSSQ
jgi:hypothetical protein